MCCRLETLRTSRCAFSVRYCLFSFVESRFLCSRVTCALFSFFLSFSRLPLFSLFLSAALRPDSSVEKRFVLCFVLVFFFYFSHVQRVQSIIWYYHRVRVAEMRRRKAEKDSSARTRGKKKKKGKRMARCACPISHTFGGCLPPSNPPLSLSFSRSAAKKGGKSFLLVFLFII